MNIDEQLPALSRQNFYYLESGELRIIKFIAKSGPLNLSEIGELTSKYTMGFDRWGVVKRLEGSTQFGGLVKQNYLYKFQINKKESKYGLTVKGLLATLRMSRFDKIYLVKQYRKFLKKYTQDEQKLECIFDYIKSEIFILLYHNQLQGVDWTKFRYLKSYFDKRRSTLFHHERYLDLEIEPPFWGNQEKEKYDDVRGHYFKSFKLCHDLIDSKNIESSKTIYDKLVTKLNTPQEIKCKMMEKVILYVAVTLWYQYVDSFELRNEVIKMIEGYLISHGKSPFKDNVWLTIIRKNETKNRILSINW